MISARFRKAPRIERGFFSPAGRRASCALARLLLLLCSGVGGVAAAEADLRRAEEIVAARCFLCHGMAGESASPLFPRLAGQNADYLVRQLEAFRSGQRRSPAMQPQGEVLNGAEVRALGRYFESQSAMAHPATADARLLELGQRVFTRGSSGGGEACADCHGQRGHGSARLPRLAGQHPEYIARQLGLFLRAERTSENDAMREVATRLSAEEIRAVAEYLATLD